MELVKGAEALVRTLHNPVVSVGNFDGVHIGHQRLLEQTIQKAKNISGTSVVLTFRPHPREALKCETDFKLLNTYEERAAIIARLGVDVIIEQPFTREFSEIGSEEFFSSVLLHRLNAQAVVVGYDFAFGRERGGQLETLKNFCERFSVELTVLPPQRIGGEVVSSSLIRRYCTNGQVEAASKLLGRDFFYRGVVLKGDGRGRQLGYPTANIRIEDNVVRLAHGVYATRTTVSADTGAKTYPSITNVGMRPTFNKEDKAALVETYLLDQDIDLYGSVIDVSFVSRIRDEVKFPGEAELKKQIRRDIDDARKRLGLSG
jgi:riboflavin kinase/FMN adenylyltransferase